MGDEQYVKLFFDDDIAVNWVRDECGAGDGEPCRIEYGHNLLRSTGSTEQCRDTEGSNS
jgi:hypothetical protein